MYNIRVKCPCSISLVNLIAAVGPHHHLIKNYLTELISYRNNFQVSLSFYLVFSKHSCHLAVYLVFFCFPAKIFGL